jgi:serine kinase of HPr protein (carbohydrate metabolism regulator)
LHGAVVMRNGKGVMLTGDSFAGKSTLAYACARAGWTYVSDDAASLVRACADRFVVGDPHSIRFRPDAPELFPELSDHLATVRPNGKVAIEVLTRQLGLTIAAAANIDHVVYLNREGAPQAATIGRLSKESVRDQLASYAVLGTQQVRREQFACYDRLLEAELWEMQYSDLDNAVARLERLVDGGA